MSLPSVSVVVVTRHRPKELLKSLRALRLQTYGNFEIVVVGDPGIGPVLGALNIKDGLKQSLFDESNISRARNIGIDEAGGEIVAFLDDDAVPEPTWLERLIAPFEDPTVGATGGFTRGRNGISHQWTAETIDRLGWSHPFDLDDTKTFAPSSDAVIKTHGTNCAFRREILVRLGGFDENFRFFLEDGDMNTRIAQAGYSTALVPLAEVQHGYAPSERRGSNRAPRSLYEIAASHAYFQKKHAKEGPSLGPIEESQQASLLRHMVDGRLEPRDVRRLSSQVRAGFAEGKTRRPRTQSRAATGAQFLPLPIGKMADHQVLYANWRQRELAFGDASLRARNGESVTLMIFSPTTLFHRRWFHESGFWVQTGGLYGKSLRGDPVYRRYTAFERAERERKLVLDIRRAVKPPLPIATQSP